MIADNRGMKSTLLTTYEASRKHGLSTAHLRRLMDKGVIKGRNAKLTPHRAIWLINEASLKKYLAQDRKPGPKPAP